MDSETDDGKIANTHYTIAYGYEQRIKKGKIDWINIKRKCRDKFNKNKTNSQ